MAWPGLGDFRIRLEVGESESEGPVLARNLSWSRGLSALHTLQQAGQDLSEKSHGFASISNLPSWLIRLQICGLRRRYVTSQHSDTSSYVLAPLLSSFGHQGATTATSSGVKPTPMWSNPRPLVCAADVICLQSQGFLCHLALVCHAAIFRNLAPRLQEGSCHCWRRQLPNTCNTQSAPVVRALTCPVHPACSQNLCCAWTKPRRAVL